jgi:hypothetical protein
VEDKNEYMRILGTCVWELNLEVPGQGKLPFFRVLYLLFQSFTSTVIHLSLSHNILHAPILTMLSFLNYNWEVKNSPMFIGSTSAGMNYVA